MILILLEAHQIYHKTKEKIAQIILTSLIISGYYYFTFYREQLKWHNYFAKANTGQPNSLLLDFFQLNSYKDPSSVIALDLGAGNGNDTLFLLNKEFSVIAVDFHEKAIERIRSKLKPQTQNNIQIIKSSFQDLEWDTLPMFDIIVAINSISFIDPNDFKTLWPKIASHIKPGGFLITRLFGNKIKWPNMQNMTLLDQQDIKALTSDFDIIKQAEELYTENSIKQHAFNLILKKHETNSTT